MPLFDVGHVADRAGRGLLAAPRLAALTLTAALLQLPGLLSAAPPKAPPRPNIVLIMADDMGYSDIGCYGGEVHTPSLDQLAADGLRFTQFYNTGRCCPTRASLLSGLYPHQAGVGWMMQDSGFDGYRGELNRNCRTIAEVLKTAGYSTYMAGKWHVTKSVAKDGPKDNWPRQRGFDRFFGTIHGAGSFYDPNSLTRDNTQIPPGDNFYYTDAISANAVTFIKDHQRKTAEKPLFLYVAYTAPHWPMHALPEDIQRYRGRYDNGWDAVRTSRYLRMRKLGLLDKRWKLSPRDKNVPAWRDAQRKSWHTRRMEVYAAMIDRMDQGIGKIVAALKKTGRMENTLLLFLADNGGCAEEYGSRGPVRPAPRQLLDRKPIAPDALQTRMQPAFTRDGRPVRTGEGVMPGPADTYIAYGQPWANVSNTPFRRYKHWVHEGGISTPLIAHWPAGIKRHGEWERQPGHLIDIMATCVDVSGAAYPKKVGDQPIKPLEGRSLRPAFAGKPIQREALYWEHEGNRAVRVGKWKLVAQGKNGPWELYDLEVDRSELTDLSKKYPERAKEMAQLWEAYARRANVYPLTPYYRKRSSQRSRKKRFQLTSGADLPQSRAPDVQGRALTIDAQVETDARSGVVVAQGGTAHGYALFLQDGVPTFAVRIRGKLTTIKAEAALAGGAHHLRATLHKDGKMQLFVGSQAVASGKAARALASQPVDGLQVGRDLNGPVGAYAAPFALTGKIKVEIRLDSGS